MESPREDSSVYSIEDDDEDNHIQSNTHNAYQRLDNQKCQKGERTAPPETETRARHTAGPQIHTQTPRSRSTEPGVHLVEITQCCALTRFIPCLRKVRIWCVQDICGMICAGLTWMLIGYALFVVLFVMLLPEIDSLYNSVNASVFLFFALLAAVAHLNAMVTDPGAIPIGNATHENIQRLGLKDGQVVYKCAKCCSLKPDRAHHCSICQRCIRKMDHHCPWVNNCVGENNQKYFVLFTLYIAVISFHAIFIVISHFVTCMNKDWKGCSSYSPPATVILMIFLIFESLLFAIFTAVMFSTQLSAICSDETGIEQLKKEGASWNKKSRWANVKSVFGSPFSLKWFSPFHAPNMHMGKLEPYQYCV